MTDRWPALIQTSIPTVIDYPVRSLSQSWYVFASCLALIAVNSTFYSGILPVVSSVLCMLMAGSRKSALSPASYLPCASKGQFMPLVDIVHRYIICLSLLSWKIFVLICTLTVLDFVCSLSPRACKVSKGHTLFKIRRCIRSDR